MVGAAAQNFTMTKTPSPATYTAAGQAIVYTFVIRNNRPADDALLDDLTDNRIPSGNIVCPTNFLAANSTLTCTGTYITTAADVTSGSVTNIATARIDTCFDTCFTTI